MSCVAVVVAIGAISVMAYSQASELADEPAVSTSPAIVTADVRDEAITQNATQIPHGDIFDQVAAQAPGKNLPTVSSPVQATPALVAENGSYYGEISDKTGLPRTTAVQGYYRKDGTYVRGYYRSK
jgi:hypothetical protein